MTARLPRVALVVLMILGLVMPRVSAVIAAVAPGVQTVVICTGAGLQTIRIGEGGKPATIGHQVDHCVLTHAADIAARVEPVPTLAPRASIIVRPGDQVRASGYQAARPPPRGPPAA